jgi:hypothetical protein
MNLLTRVTVPGTLRDLDRKKYVLKPIWSKGKQEEFGTYTSREPP